MKMDNDFGENLNESQPKVEGAVRSPAAPQRYDFEVPERIPVADMIAVQVAECARMMIALSDTATGGRLDSVDRMHTIHSVRDIVTASAELAECFDRLHGGVGWRTLPPQPRKKT
jgi:hypothetical protein